MSFNETAFHKENLDLYLRELAKAFRKLNGKSNACRNHSHRWRFGVDQLWLP